LDLKIPLKLNVVNDPTKELLQFLYGVGVINKQSPSANCYTMLMRNLETEITIKASPAEVWDILLNHEAYAEWNPFIKEISGPAQPGEKLLINIQPPDSKAMVFKPLVLVNEKEKEFRWIGKLFVKGIFDGEHYFLLESVGPNETHFTQGENFTGILSGLMMKMIGKNTLSGFESMNEALKKKAES